MPWLVDAAARVAEIAWLLGYLPEIESDLSVFHRIDDVDAMPADRFWRFTERLVHYQGALVGRLRADMTADRDAEPPMKPVEQVATAPLTASPEDIARTQNSPLFAPLPGEGAVFAHSYAPRGSDA